MVDWRKWPEEVGRIADPRSLPDWVRGPEIQKEARAEMFRALPILLLAMGVPAAVAFTLFHFYAPSGNGPVAACIAFGFLVCMTASVIGIGRWSEEWSGQRRRRRILDLLEAREERVLGDEVVGVTYSDTLWRDTAHGDSWDWGALRLEMDRLSFVGRSSRFDLRPESIRNLEIKRVNSLVGVQGRLCLTWDDGGKSETLIFELPFVRSRRRRVEAINDLRERIDRWRKEPLPSYDRTPLIPPPSVENLRPFVNPITNSSFTAKLLGALAVFLLALVTEVLLMLLLLALHLGRYGGYLSVLIGLFVVLWIPVTLGIERRLPNALRHRNNEEESPNFNLGEEKAVDADSTLEIRQ